MANYHIIWQSSKTGTIRRVLLKDIDYSTLMHSYLIPYLQEKSIMVRTTSVDINTYIIIKIYTTDYPLSYLKVSKGISDNYRLIIEQGKDVTESCLKDAIDVITKIKEPNSFTEPKEISKSIISPIAKPSDKIFIVHGHDEAFKLEVARFIENDLGLKAVILHEQPNKGRTLIEKLQDNISDGVGFGVVLYTPCDWGLAKNSYSEKQDIDSQLKSRARQNVVFEHGLLMGLLGQSKVVPIIKGDTEEPGDIKGIVYIGEKDWKISLRKELVAADYKLNP